MQRVLITYATFKQVMGSLKVYYKTGLDGSRRCYVFAENYTVYANLDPGSSELTDFETNKMPTSQSIETENEGAARAALTRKSLIATPRTTDARPRLAIEKTDATKKTIISHDWTDPTTWTQTAVRVVDEVAVDSGDHLTYTLAHPMVIDTYHGKVSQEDFLKSAANNSFRVAVKVNDIAKTEQDPHFASGSDFTVNYETGSLTFLVALDPADEVKVTYHYSTVSTFTIKPDTGKQLKIEFAEAQFADDVEILDSVIFQPYGFVDVFAPQLIAQGIPSGTLIPLGNPVVYKTMSDYQNDAVKSYPTYPELGGNGWRGSPKKIVIFDWDYVASTVLRSDYGMEIRISLQHNQPFSGWYSTVTFYCVSENE